MLNVYQYRHTSELGTKNRFGMKVKGHCPLSPSHTEGWDLLTAVSCDSSMLLLLLICISLRWQCSSFVFSEAMRLELSPIRVEVTVGESVVLSCKATHDTSLDVAFQWFFNQRPISFQQYGGHFENIQTVRARVSIGVCQSGSIDFIIIYYFIYFNILGYTSKDLFFLKDNPANIVPIFINN